MNAFEVFREADNAAQLFKDSAPLTCQCGHNATPVGSGDAWVCSRCSHKNTIPRSEVYRRRRIIFLNTEHPLGYDPDRLTYMLKAVTYDPQKHPPDSPPLPSSPPPRSEKLQRQMTWAMLAASILMLILIATTAFL